MNPFHHPGNNRPQTKHFIPVRTFGFHSLNNLLLFFQPATIEEKLHLIEAYIIVNDWNSAEALLEQLYDDIKCIDIHATYQSANNMNDEQTLQSIVGPRDTDDAKADEFDSLQSKPNPLKLGLADKTDKMTPNELIEHYLQLAYQLRVILKQNSLIIQQLRGASAHILDDVRVVQPESWMFKPNTKGLELALELEKQQSTDSHETSKKNR